MLISAIICTYKRADYLQHALASLNEQTLPRKDYEVVVVDNAVEDATRRVVSKFQETGLNVRYVPETEVGLNRARNTGYKAAAGRYVAFIDDDARADVRWLESLVQTFEKFSPAPVAVGGRVWLDWHGPQPSWVPERLLPMFTYVDHGDATHPLRDDEYLVGANLAVEKDALSAIGGFTPNLDRQGAVLLSGGDTLVVEELKRTGRNVCYEPAAVVWHSVLPSRKRPSWLLRRMFWDGASQPLVNGVRLSRRTLLRFVAFDLRQCFGWLAHVLMATLRGSKHSAWESLLGLSQRAGRMRTHLRMFAFSGN